PSQHWVVQASPSSLKRTRTPARPAARSCRARSGHAGPRRCWASKCLEIAKDAAAQQGVVGPNRVAVGGCGNVHALAAVPRGFTDAVVDQRVAVAVDPHAIPDAAGAIAVDDVALEDVAGSRLHADAGALVVAHLVADDQRVRGNAGRPQQ